MSDQPKPVDDEYFGSNNGGDLILRTCDNIDFNVHSIVLTLASPVLADMFKLSNRQAVVQVSENAELLGIMLNFTYPRSNPEITSFKTFSDAVDLADKYELTGMMGDLRKEFTRQGSKVSIYSDPMLALAIASRHGFAHEAELASSRISERSLSSVNELVKFASAMPSSARAIKLVGSQFARMVIVTDFLLRFNGPPMSNKIAGISCTMWPYCQWRVRWAIQVIREGRAQSYWGMLDYFTSHSRLLSLDPADNSLSRSCPCAGAVFGSQSCFDAWVKPVREELVNRLKALDQLNTIA